MEVAACEGFTFTRHRFAVNPTPSQSGWFSSNDWDAE
jgi:hypothetical protein